MATSAHTDVDRHDLELRDVQDGELHVSYNHVERGVSHMEAYHCSDRLPIECLSLFDGGTLDPEDLTAEEKAWIEAEGDNIVFDEVGL